jgi:hypothetical protein
MKMSGQLTVLGCQQEQATRLPEIGNRELGTVN